MRRRLALLLALPLVAAAACGGSDDDATVGDEDGVEATTTTEEPDGDPDAIPGFSVEVLDPGAEPRQELRLRPPEDCELPVRQSQRVEQRVTAQGEEQAGTSAFEYDITYRCESVGDGRITVVSHYDDARVTEQDTGGDELDELIEGFVGKEGRITFDDRGQVLEVDLPDVDVPQDYLGPAFAKAMEQMLDQMESSVAQSAAPFPEEAIGIGGRWRVTGELEISGLLTRLQTEYRVTELTQDRLLADTTSTLEFLPGPVDLPGGRTGASAEIVGGTITGSGTTEWDLGGVVAYLDQTLEGTTTMRFEGRGESFEMEQYQRQELSLQPR